MKPLITFALALLIAISANSQVIDADILPPKPLTTVERIVKYATRYATPAEPLIRVARCESTLNAKAYNPKDVDGLPAYGLFQFKKSTFDSYSKKAGIATPDIWDEDQQAQVAAYMFSTGQKKQWGCK